MWAKFCLAFNNFKYINVANIILILLDQWRKFEICNKLYYWVMSLCKIYPGEISYTFFLSFLNKKCIFMSLQANKHTICLSPYLSLFKVLWSFKILLFLTFFYFNCLLKNKISVTNIAVLKFVLIIVYQYKFKSLPIGIL